MRAWWFKSICIQPGGLAEVAGPIKNREPTGRRAGRWIQTRNPVKAKTQDGESRLPLEPH